MIDERLIKLQHFFEIDMRIKKGMYSLAPAKLQYFDESSMQRYTDDLDDLLSYIFTELKCVSVDIFGKKSNVLARVCSLEKVVKKSFYSCGFDINKLREFYKTYVSNMHIGFINSVKDECVGYSFSGTNSAEMAVTINEMLHFIHSYVVNNDHILKAVPVINQKNNEFNYPITLRGIEVPEFNQLFEQFPLDLDVGWTEMVTINEKKLIMMVRDRGHALTIEISLNNDIARIEYFIPKLCNIEMINNLPGVNRVDKNSVGATGVIEVPTSALAETLYDFISKVPMDSDMVFESRKTM